MDLLKPLEVPTITPVLLKKVVELVFEVGPKFGVSTTSKLLSRQRASDFSLLFWVVNA
jgi:hypothetical protein